MEDIVPSLLKQIQDDFQNEFGKSKIIKELYIKVRDGTATYSDTNEFAIETGEILANAYKRNISSDILPDGKLYYNIAQRIIEPTMKNNYNLIVDIASQVQKTLNEAARIGIKPIIPQLNQDRIDGIVNRVSSADNYDDVAWIMDEPIKNFSQSIVDDSIRANAEFHSDAGMQPKIVRKLMGGCCAWCRALAGTYEYPNNIPRDVYRRHQRCRCTVDYIPGNGKVQNVHSKKWQKIKDYQKRTEQHYLPVRGSEAINIIDKKMGIINLTKIDGYDSVYVSDDVKIKPKALHNINKNITDAINAYGGNVKNKPLLIIVDKAKLGGALGKYDCVKNVIYIAPDAGDKKLLSAFMTLDRNIRMGSIEYHETWHWMQAQSYGKEITVDNRDTDYMPWLMKKCKKNIESLGITQYNVSSVSDYAEDAFYRGRFDEVEAEYYSQKMLKERM